MSNVSVAARETLACAHGMVDRELFLTVLDKIKCYGRKGTACRWVNWRKDQFQIKVSWNGSYGFSCYLNFFSAAERDAVLAQMFKRYAGEGAKPYREDGHGWSRYRYDFFTPSQISINELAQVANEMGIQYTVIYVQECVTYRPLFADMGIPLVPGEMGKELIDGVMHPYSRETGKNL